MYHALSGGSLNSLNEPGLATIRIRDEPGLQFEANADQALVSKMVPARSVISQVAIAGSALLSLRLSDGRCTPPMVEPALSNFPSSSRHPSPERRRMGPIVSPTANRPVSRGWICWRRVDAYEHRVGILDLLAGPAGKLGACKGCPAEFDGNRTVGASDLLILLVNWR